MVPGRRMGRSLMQYCPYFTCGNLDDQTITTSDCDTGSIASAALRKVPTRHGDQHLVQLCVVTPTSRNAGTTVVGMCR
jgi:hypothetical protein